MELTIGEKIRKKRKQMRLTLKELAGDKVTPAQISAVEKGKCKPSYNLLEHIANKLDTEIEFFTLSDEERFRRDFNSIREISQKHYDEGNFAQTLKVLESVNEILLYMKDEQKGFFYYMQANCAYKVDECNKAFNLFVKALTYYLKTRDINTIGDIYNKIGNCLYKTGKHDMALGYYLSAKGYIDSGLEDSTAAKILFNIALCYVSLDRYSQAEEYVERCLKHIDSHNWKGKEKIFPGIYMLKGIVEGEMNENKSCLEEFGEAFKKYQLDNDVSGMGRAKNNTALALWDLGEREKAVECFYESIKYKSECGDETLVDTYLNLAEKYKETGDYAEALEVINSAEAEMLKTNYASGLIEVFTRKFEYLVEIKDYNRAEVFAFLALDYIEKSKDVKAESKLYRKMSEMYKNMGDENSAINYLLKANCFFA